MNKDDMVVEKIKLLEEQVASLAHRVKILESHDRVLCGNGKTEYVYTMVENYALEQAKKERADARP